MGIGYDSRRRLRANSMLNVLCCGSSSALGRGDSDGTNFTKVSGNIRVWDNQTHVDTMTYPGSKYVEPRTRIGKYPFRTSPLSQNFGLWFCSTVALNYDWVNYVLVGHGGGAWGSQWLPSTGFVYEQLSEVYPLAIQEPTDVFLWYNAQVEDEDHTDNISTMLADMMSREIISEDTKILLMGASEISSSRAAWNDNILEPYANSLPNGAFVDPTGLTTVSPGNVHMDNPSLVTFGRRAADVFLQM